MSNYHQQNQNTFDIFEYKVQLTVPAAKFIGIFLTSHVKVEAQISINANTEVVVHNEDGRRVLVGVGRVTLVHDCDLCLVYLCLIGVKDHSPPVHNTM